VPGKLFPRSTEQNASLAAILCYCGVLVGLRKKTVSCTHSTESKELIVKSPKESYSLNRSSAMKNVNGKIPRVS